MSMSTTRKRTKFQICERHASLAVLPRKRRAEFFVEGGPAGQSGCEGGICRLWPGTDMFDPSVCTGEFDLDWTKPPTNAADPGSRDGRIAAEISDAENVVEDLASRLGTLVEEAADAEAFGHGGLYEAVQSHLTAAAKDLRRAYENLRNGDPEDHNDWRP